MKDFILTIKVINTVIHKNHRCYTSSDCMSKEHRNTPMTRLDARVPSLRAKQTSPPVPAGSNTDRSTRKNPNVPFMT